MNQAKEAGKQKPVSDLSKGGERVKKKHPNWSDELCNTIAQKKIRIGMTSEQVKAAWGRPQRINSSTYSWGNHDQWVYGSSNYVYFKDGIMTSLQQSK